MQNHRKKLAALLSVTSLVGVVWFFFLFPEEPWIRYNFAVRFDEISAMAVYVEGQDTFKNFACVEDGVWLDKRAAPDTIRKELENLCRTSRILMGDKTDYGSFFHLGSGTRWFNEYWIALVHDPILDDAEDCSRWGKLDPAEECLVRLNSRWAIHYWNAPLPN